MKRSYIIGGRSGSVMTAGLGHLKLVGVKLDPRLLRWIIGTPLVEFRDSTLDLVDLNHKPLLVLEDALAGATSVRQMVTALDAFFLRQFETYTQQDRLLATLLKTIHASRGVLAITRWVREHGMDPRTLERRFSAWMGMGPKRYARIVRFRHSYHRLITAQWRRTPACAEYLDGYYDQSHFNKEFRYFTGTTPSVLVADRSRSSTQVTNHLLEGDYSPAALARP
jgi:AraC-like DNA-binding protein